MSFWQLLEISMIAFSVLGAAYLGWRIGRFDIWRRMFPVKVRRLSVAILLVAVIFGGVVYVLGFMNAVIALFYVVLIWAGCDGLSWLGQKAWRQSFKRYYAGQAAIVLSLIYLLNGWYQAHNVAEVEYVIETTKKVSNLRIAMLADAHIGTTFSGAELARHVKQMQKYKPDMLVIVGDLVDNSTSRDELLSGLDALAKLKTTYGIYAVLGNHDISSNGMAFRGFSNADLVAEMQKRGMKVLQDEVQAIGNEFYVIGRKDAYEPRRGRSRKKMADLVKGLDKAKFMLVLDHQPSDYAKQAEAKVDLVLSGHTHGGQLFPFNYVSQWAGMNDRIYGHEKRQNTDFIVTSGISDWEVKFKTGCQSEFVVVDIKAE